MAARLEGLPSADELYDYRRADPGGVPLWLPHNQGDVFDDIDLTTVAGEPGSGMVMLFLHPCTMRRGNGELIECATVIRVRPKSVRKPLDEPHKWANHYSVIPLPDFSGTKSDAFEGDLFAMGTVPMFALQRAKRVASLSGLGRSHMLHRVIFHLTRLAVPTVALQQATAIVQTELQLQADWCEIACARLAAAEERSVEKYEAEFQSLLNEPWPDGSPDVPETIRTKLTSENSADREDAYKHIQTRIESGEPGASVESR